jgi:hypothetical protein
MRGSAVPFTSRDTVSLALLDGVLRVQTPIGLEQSLFSAPTIDLAVGYSKANTSPILKLFLSRMDALIGFATLRLHVPSGK